MTAARPGTLAAAPEAGNKQFAFSGIIVYSIQNELQAKL
jgi:hypothetical protein